MEAEGFRSLRGNAQSYKELNTYISFCTYMPDIDEESARERQSRVAKSGEDWEKYVKLFLEEKLKNTEIEILEESKARSNKEINKRLSIPADFKEETIWNDVDLLAVKDSLPIAVINCKGSIHGRLGWLFWGIVFSINRKVKLVIATPDMGSNERTEWGTPKNPNKYRRLARRYIDGIYVQNVKNFCGDVKTNFGEIVRHLEELPSDIERWSKDLKFVSIDNGGRNLGNFA